MAKTNDTTTLLIGMEGGLVPGDHHLTMGIPVVLDEARNKAVNWYTKRSVPYDRFLDPEEDIAQAITSWLCPVPVGPESDYDGLEEPLEEPEAWGPRIVAILRGSLTYKALEGLGTDLPVIVNRLPIPVGEITPESQHIDVAFRLVRDLPAWSEAAYPRLVRMIVSEYFVPGQGNVDQAQDDFDNLVHAAMTVQVVKSATKVTDGWGIIPYVLSAARLGGPQRERVIDLYETIKEIQKGKARPVLEALEDLKNALES